MKKKKNLVKINQKDVRPIQDAELPRPLDTVINEGFVSESKKLKGIGWWQRRKLRKKPEHSFLITMIFSNGTSRRFIITTNKEMFEYKKRLYNLRYEDSLFSLTDNQYILFYHEDFINPIDRKIQRIGNTDYFTTTPENIAPIIAMEYVKALSSSIELNKFFRSALALGILGLLLGLANLFFMLRLSKMIKILAGGT